MKKAKVTVLYPGQDSGGRVLGEPRVDLDEISDSDEAGAVLALTADNGFVASVADALEDPEQVQWVTNAKEILAATQHVETSALVIDAAVGVSQLPPFVSNLKRARPNLVIIVAGERADSSDLIELVSSGHVFRLLFKPLAQGLTRLAIEAALLRAPEQTDPQAIEVAEGSFEGSRWWLPYAIGGAVAVAVVTTLLVWLLSGDEPEVVAAAPPPQADVATIEQPPAPSPAEVAAIEQATGAVAPEPVQVEAAVQADPKPAVQTAPEQQSPLSPTEQLLARARLAVSEGRYVTPAEDNAAAHYRQVLVVEPDNPEARAGLERMTAALLADVEQDLVAGRIDDARQALSAARELQPSHQRIAFLATQIDKEDQRDTIARALRLGQEGDVETATAMLDQVAVARPELTEELALALDKLAQLQGRGEVNEWLERGSARLGEGQLIEPDDDSASFYFQSVLEVEPTNTAALAGLGDVAAALVEQARAATRAGDFRAASKRLEEAGGFGVEAPGLASARRELKAARAKARAAAERKKNLRLLALGRERLEQNRLVEPEEDSAKHYLLAFQAVEPDNGDLRESLELLSAELTGRAGAEIARQEFDAAGSWIDEAADLGVRTEAVAELRQTLDIERQIAALPPLVKHTELQRLEFVAPEYPRRANVREIEGKVRMEFTVSGNGTVEAVEVTEAEPEGWFEAAAMAALQQWRYEPTVIGGRALTRRAWVVFEFRLED